MRLVLTAKTRKTRDYILLNSEIKKGTNELVKLFVLGVGNSCLILLADLVFILFLITGGRILLRFSLLRKNWPNLQIKS